MMNTVIRVLCVDDESAFLDISSLFLERSGDFQVKTAQSASDAIKLLETEHFDAIISDYQMPGMDGIQFLVEVRNRFGPIPFILFTGRGREEVVILAVDKGADSYVQKGGETKSQFAELAHKIRMAIKRRTAENRKEESQEILKTVIAEAKEGIIAYNRDLRITLWNRFMEELTGLNAADVQGKITFELFPFIEQAANDELMKKALTGITTESADFEFSIPSTGKKGWVKSIYTPNYDAQGTIAGVIGIIRDVTERKRAEEAFQESEERYRKMFENSPLGMVLSTPDLRFFSVNPAWVTMTGYSEKELLEMSFKDITHPDHLALDLQRGEELAAGTIPVYSMEKQYIRRDGSILWGQVRISTIRDEKGTLRYFAAQIEDISERKLSGDALNKANRKLNLLSGVTRHDISNQLTVLDAYITLLEEQYQDPDSLKQFKKITTAIQRINEMIQFTKEYESIGVNAPVWQNCRTLIETATGQAPLVYIIVKNDIPFSAEVFADPLIVKVFYNLMDNAARYGGKITTIRFFVKEDTNDYTIVCEDDGDGIAAEEKEQIFEQGFGKNTGMGLFLAKEILDMTGITIRETGVPGKGARFELTVPFGSFRT
ncbi:MAG: PAS domain S-box protein [Methanoregula sp.]